MFIVLNAGHTQSGYGSGALGYLNESKENRKIVEAVKTYLEMKGHKVIIDNVDKAASNTEYLKKVVNTANKSKCDLFVSIHLNGGGGKGCEVYTWQGRKYSSAVGVCEELSKLGFRNRGVKDGSMFYVIKKTTMEAMLIEVCFVDNLEDYELYKRVGVSKIGQAIANGLTKSI